MKDVYLDHAATTPIDPRVREAMLPFLDELYGNPSSFHSVGKQVKDRIDEARSSVAEIIGARSDEILFTSGGSESDNLAMLGYCRIYALKPAGETGRGHIITTSIEHQAILEPLYQLEKKEGFDVTYLKVDEDGLVSVKDVKAALREDTILVSIIYANNEIGTIQPIEEIGTMIEKYRAEKKQKIVFHTDACQAAGALEIDVRKLHVDLMTLNASKIYGPKGIGMLYVKRGTKLRPLQFGGAQEKGIRPGTENILGIIGFAKALEIADKEKQEHTKRLIPLREKLIKGIQGTISKTRLNGHAEKRLPNNVNISIMDLEGEALILYLDSKGIYVSTGSACTSASLDPSHVILALGMPYEVAHGSIRFTLGRSTTEEDIDYVIEVLPPLVKRLRSISPVRVDKKYYEKVT